MLCFKWPGGAAVSFSVGKGSGNLELMLWLHRQHQDSSELLIHVFAMYLCTCVRSWAGTEVAGIPLKRKGEECLAEGEEVMEVMELLRFGALAESLTRRIGGK